MLTTKVAQPTIHAFKTDEVAEAQAQSVRAYIWHSTGVPDRKRICSLLCRFLEASNVRLRLSHHEGWQSDNFVHDTSISEWWKLNG